MQILRGGVYICFLDADDWLPIHSVEYLYRRMKESNADIVCGGYARVLISGLKKSYVNNIDFSIQDKIKLSNNISCTVPPWANLYRVEVIREHNIRFPLDVTINEDTLFVYTYLQYCERIAFTSKNTYYWSHLNNSSFSRKIHMDMNLCYARALAIRHGFFDFSNLPSHEYRIILELFCVCLMVYTNKLPYAEATDKIRETYEIFRQFLELIDDDWLSSSDDRFSKQYKVCRRDLSEGKYDLVYQNLLASSKMSAKAALKKGLRKLLVPVEQFFVFRLNWFYK